MASPRAIVDVIEDVTFERVQDGDKSILKVKGTAKRADFINKNRRYYHQDVLSKSVDSIQDEVKAGGLIGLMEHPDLFEGPKGAPQKTAVKWTDVKMVGKDVLVEGVVVKTAAGRDLEALVDAKVKIGLSTNMRGSSRYVKASELDANYEPKDAYIQVFDAIDFNTIDVVNSPADGFASLAAKDSLEEELKDMTKEELKAKFPELYTSIADEAKAGGNAAGAADKAVDDLTAEVAKLRTENAKFQDQIKIGERKSVVDGLLADAELPKLGVVGKLDLDARFRKRLEDVAVAAEDVTQARDAVQELIEEQKALLGVGGDPKVSKDTVADNSPGVKRRTDDKKADAAAPMVQSIRGDFGLY